VKHNPAHILFEKHLTELGLYFIAEYCFHPKRKWRADYFIGDDPEFLEMPRMYGDTLIEIEGAIFSHGRDTRGKGYQKDLDKYNAAIAEGFKVYRFYTQDVLRGRAKAFLAEHVAAKAHRARRVY
jgi:hypothetical protein